MMIVVLYIYIHNMCVYIYISLYIYIIIYIYRYNSIYLYHVYTSFVHFWSALLPARKDPFMMFISWLVFSCKYL